MYVVDANVLIEAKNRYYAFDLAPGFWEWLNQMCVAGDVFSIEPVYDELRAGKDDLAVWAQEHPDFFRPLGQGPVQYFSLLSQWAVSQKFTKAALAQFTGNNADYLLVTFARAYGCTVVTNEVSAPMGRKRVKIPDACKAMGVAVTTTFEMMRRCGAQLVLP